MTSNTRLYGAAIALTSGLYSIWSASTAMAFGPGGLVMLLVGIIVVLHGGLLLTPYADRLGRASGPLMIGYAALMLLNQAVLGAGMSGEGMQPGSGMGGMPAGASADWDAGMVALAALMLVSGVIMFRDGPGDESVM